MSRTLPCRTSRLPPRNPRLVILVVAPLLARATPQRIVTVTFHLVKTGWAVFRMFDECPFSLMLGHSH